MAAAKTRKEFDTRVINFHLRTGNITADQHQAHLAELPDDADEAVEVEVKFDNAYERRLEQEDGDSD